MKINVYIRDYIYIYIYIYIPIQGPNSNNIKSIKGNTKYILIHPLTMVC